jgi:hypothetical protein
MVEQAALPRVGWAENGEADARADELAASTVVQVIPDEFSYTLSMLLCCEPDFSDALARAGMVNKPSTKTPSSMSSPSPKSMRASTLARHRMISDLICS